MKALKITIKTLNILVIIAFVVLLILNVHNVIAMQFHKRSKALKIFGYSHHILAINIEDDVQAGSYLVLKEQKEYEVQDVVTYKDEQGFGAQKIVEKDEDGYLVKDSPALLTNSKIVGKTVMVVPKLGNILIYLRTPLGMLLLVLGGALIFASPRLIR